MLSVRHGSEGGGRHDHESSGFRSLAASPFGRGTLESMRERSGAPSFASAVVRQYDTELADVYVPPGARKLIGEDPPDGDANTRGRQVGEQRAVMGILGAHHRDDLPEQRMVALNDT